MSETIEITCDKKIERVQLDGPQKITFTQANHAHCEGYVNINSKMYVYSAHLLKTGPNWLPSKDDKVYVHNNPTPSARSKGINYIPQLLNIAIRETEWQTVLAARVKAHQKFLKRTEERLTSDIEGLEKVLSERKIYRQKTKNSLQELEESGTIPESYSKFLPDLKSLREIFG